MSSSSIPIDARSNTLVPISSSPVSTNAQSKALVPWIFSGQRDFFFFFAATFLGVAYGFITNTIPTISELGNLVIYSCLGLAHFGSTWAYYLDQEYREYFKSHKVIFYVIPIILILVTMGLIGSGLVDVLMIITYWFSGFHVMKQNTGFASIYRTRIGDRAPASRQIDNTVIMGFSALCLLGRPQIFTDFGYEYIFRTPWMGYALAAAAILMGLVFIYWVSQILSSVKEKGMAAVPRFLFVITSIVMFLPFLFVEDFSSAFMAALAGHYVQYLGFVWTLNRRKYTAAREKRYHSSILKLLSQNGLVLATVLIGYGVIMVTGSKMSSMFPVIGMSWAHFFVDRYLFRFRDPFIREALTPFMKAG